MNNHRFSRKLLSLGLTLGVIIGVLVPLETLHPVLAETVAVSHTLTYSPGAPFADTSIGNYPGMALGDIDGDGKADALAGDQFGQITYYHNGSGDNLTGLFYREPLSGYPAGLSIYIGNSSHNSKTIPRPELFDYNQDGKLDLFVAGWNSNPDLGEIEKPTVLYFERQQNGSFQQKLDNPFSRAPEMLELDVKWLAISVGDLNSDSLPDAVIAYFQRIENTAGGIYHISVLINNGPGVDPTLLDPNPFPEDNLSKLQKGVPRLADLNGDGALDLVVGYGEGILAYYQNTGSGGNIAFTQKFGPANPFNPPGAAIDAPGPDIGRDAVPCLANLDGDADLDMLAASADGRVTYFRNDGSLQQPLFTQEFRKSDPFRGLDGGLKNSIADPGASTITFGDLDGDGLPDALVGGVFRSQIRNFHGEKDGPAAGDFHFRELPLEGKWFDSPEFSFSQPLLVDLDKNGSLDLLVAHQTPVPGIPFTISYYRNTTTPPAAPAFELIEGPEDPFYTLTQAGFKFPNYPNAAAGDFDGDNQLDLLIGGESGSIAYLRLVGNQFQQPLAAENPFGEVNIPFGAPFLGDADGDGLQDVLIGEGRLFTAADPDHKAGTIHYFLHRKASDPAGNPLFSELTGLNNPFYWFSTREFATPVLAELSGDHAPELVSGSGFGTFFYYANIGTQTRPVYRDYVYNPLARVESPDPDQIYAISVNPGDLEGDQLQDVIVGVPPASGAPAKLLYYKNVGNRNTPVFRLQPDQQNPLRDATTPAGPISVSLADTNGDGSPEAYVGGGDGVGNPVLKYYQWSGNLLVESLTEYAQQFPKGFPATGSPGPRLSFVRKTSNGLLDMYIFPGSSSGKNVVYYAANKGISTNPLYSYTSSFNEWLTGADNPFYFFNSVGLDSGFNMAWANAQTVWVGNANGSLSSMQNTFFDPSAGRYFFGPISSANDWLSNVHLVGQAIPGSADLNGDGFLDALVASGDGTVLYIASSSLKVYLPVAQR